jgi:hypothetical protein
MHWMKIVTGSCPGEPGAESGAGKSPAAASRDAYHVTKEAAICAFTPTIRELSDFSFLRECLQALQAFFFGIFFSRFMRGGSAVLVTALLLVGIAESEQYVVRGSVTASPHPYDSDSSDRLHFLATIDQLSSQVLCVAAACSKYTRALTFKKFYRVSSAFPTWLRTQGPSLPKPK